MTTKPPKWTGDAAAFVDDLFAWYRLVGATKYDEQVTQLDHALQTAENARHDVAPEAEIVAAFFHDVGHFLVDEHKRQGDFLVHDLRHEAVGAAWLTKFFPAEVTEPVRLHVPAKRWLCTMDEDYWQGLSDASKRSLEIQGGTMSPEEVTAFESHAGWQAAVALRKRDDMGKEPGRKVPALESLRPFVLAWQTAADKHYKRTFSPRAGAR